MSIATFIAKVNEYILNPLILLGFAIALVYFFYSVVKFLSLPYGHKDKDDARRAIIWGLVGMLIMFSVFGIIRFVMATFGISSGDIPTATPYLGNPT